MASKQADKTYNDEHGQNNGSVSQYTTHLDNKTIIIFIDLC